MAEKHIYKGHLYMAMWAKTFRKAEKLSLLSPRTVRARSLFQSQESALTPFSKEKLKVKDTS